MRAVRIVLVVLGLASTAAASAPSVTWSQMEPLLRARFAVRQEQGKYYVWTSEAPCPKADVPAPALKAVRDVTVPGKPGGEGLAELFRQCMLEITLALRTAAKQDPLGGDLAADSERFRAALFSQEHAARTLRNGLARLLAERGVTCADCAVPEPPPREIRFADLVPYLARFAYVGPGDLSDPDGRAHFHVCSGINGLGSIEHVDPMLATAALAAMYQASQTEVMPHVSALLQAIRKDHAGPETKELRGAVNAELARRLAEDPEFLSAMRPLLVGELAACGLACADCAAATEH